MNKVVLLSLESWDTTWRRNQHLSARLVGSGLVDRLVFVNPAAKLGHVPSHVPVPGVEVVTPHRALPWHRGGFRQVALELQATVLRGADVLWINDPRVGSRALMRGRRTVYDVTDDWRSAVMSPEERADFVAAEDELARRASTVVCSAVLQERWLSRYQVSAAVVQNGVDTGAHQGVAPASLPGPGPHAVYIGTLHAERLDLALLAALAASDAVGTLHLIGPDSLEPSARALLERNPKVRIAPPVAHYAVPGLMAAADVLLCPHLVDAFTLSLDAIKSFEYVASGRPVVATPSSGFQLMADRPGFRIVPTADYIAAVADTLRNGPRSRDGLAEAAEMDWQSRAEAFALALEGARRA